jgi:glutaminase
MPTEDASITIPEGNLLPDHPGGLETACKDILREVYWYVLRDRTTVPEELTIGHVAETLQEEGLLFWRDERFTESQDFALKLAAKSRVAFTNRISEDAQLATAAVKLDYDAFVEFVSPCARLFLKTFSEELVIPDWSTFTTDMAYHFLEVEHHKTGTNANYIPMLRDADPERWGLSICSTDGQRFSIGDHRAKFTLQSVSKPVTYALGLAQEGGDFMDAWINVEPAGRPFNTQDLDPATNCPFNSSVNSGAIMAAAIYGSNFPEYTWLEIVGNVRAKWNELSGNDLQVGFCKETYDSEKACAYNNFAIAYNLKGRRGLPRDIDLHKMLDVYLGCCSLEMTTEALAVAAATLANGGVCPITGKEVFSAHVTRTVLSELMMCGMYDQAGRFAVEVGLPSKSGVSGVLMVIVPNVFGFATLSPRLNEKGNSVRGIEFCKRLVGSYRVHLFEPLRSGNAGAKVDPRKNGWKNERSDISRMAWAVEVGDRYATRLRDIFLFALCQTAVASKEGLSERMVELIRENYEQVYQASVDHELFQEIVDAVRQHPAELRFLGELTKDVHVEDSMRSLIIMAMIDIIMIDGKVGELEESVAVRIAVLLGIDKGVALMELNRYGRNAVSRRFKDVEFCQMIQAIDADVSLNKRVYKQSPDGSRTHRKSIASRHAQLFDSGILAQGARSISNSKVRGRKAEKQKGIRNAWDQFGVEGQEENLHLRKEIIRLRRKVDLLTTMLPHDCRPSDNA